MGPEPGHLPGAEGPVLPSIDAHVHRGQHEVDVDQGEGRRLLQELDPSQEHLDLGLDLDELPLDIQGLLDGGRPPDELEHGSFGGPQGFENGLAVHVLVGHVFAGG